MNAIGYNSKFILIVVYMFEQKHHLFAITFGILKPTLFDPLITYLFMNPIEGVSNTFKSMKTCSTHWENIECRRLEW